MIEREIKRLKEAFEARGITFWIINPYAGETAAEAKEEIKELKLKHIPYMLDRKQAVIEGELDQVRAHAAAGAGA